MCSATMEETLAFFSSEHTGKLRHADMLHCHFNLAWASHSGLDRATGTLVLDRDLFARNAIGHRLAGHAYAYRARPGRDDHLITFAYYLCHFQLIRRDDLIWLSRPCQLVTQRLVVSSQVSLSKDGHVPFGKAHVGIGQYCAAQK